MVESKREMEVMRLPAERIDEALAAAYRQAVHSKLSPPSVFLTGPEGTVVHASLALCEQFGIDRARVMSHHWLTFLEEAGGQEAQEAGARHAEASPDGFDLEFVRTGLAFRLGIRRMGPAGRGCLIGLVEVLGGSASDVEPTPTSPLFALCDAMPHIVAMLDPEGRPTFVNRRFLEITGLTTDEALDPNIFGCEIYPDDRERVDDAWWSGRQAGMPFEIEYRVRHVDGGDRWTIMRSAPIRGESGEIEHWHVTGTDIDDLKRAVQELQRERNFTARIGETTPDVVFLYDVSQKRNVYCNAAALPVFGYSPEAIQEMGDGLLQTIVHPEDWPWIRVALYDSSPPADGEIVESEYRCVKPDGSCVWINNRSLVFERDPEGRVKLYLGIARDVTSRKLAELEQIEHTRILQNALSGISFLDPEGRYLYANAAYAAIEGRTAESLVGRHWSTAIHPDDLPRMTAVVQRMIQTGRVEAQCRGVREDGEEFHKAIVLIPKFDGTNFVGHYGFAQDVTERIRFQGQLEEQLSHISEMRLELEERSTDLQRANEILSHQAYSDGLTGLANHRHFQEVLAELETTGASYSLLLIDVDHFKAYNDTFGHPAGDAVLVLFSSVLRELVAPGELAARYGGEEFGIVLPGLSLQDAEVRAKVVLARFGEIEWPHRTITASIGCAASGPHSTRAGVIDQADRALYVSKRNGRNRVTAA